MPLRLQLFCGHFSTAVRQYIFAGSRLELTAHKYTNTKMHKFTNANTQTQIEAMASNASLQGAELTAAKDFTQRHGGYTVMIFLTHLNNE